MPGVGTNRWRKRLPRAFEVGGEAIEGFLFRHQLRTLTCHAVDLACPRRWPAGANPRWRTAARLAFLEGAL